MGTWYLSLAGSVLLVLLGLYIHWSVVAIGLALPFLPMVSFVLSRRRTRREARAPLHHRRDSASGSRDARP